MYTLNEFMALDPKSLVLPKPDCSICKKPISGVHSDDLRMIPAGPVHDDCYFHELGNLVEAHPPHGPRHGGHGSSDLS